MPVKIAATITFCQLLLRNAREVIVEQLELSGLKIREGSGIAPVDATVRADVVDLMARILMAVFQAEGGRIDVSCWRCARFLERRSPTNNRSTILFILMTSWCWESKGHSALSN